MKRLPALYFILFIIQFVVGITAAPYSCEWGNRVYFFTGLACLAVAFALPLFQKEWGLGKRLLVGMLLLLLSGVLWCVGFLVLDFRIMCRLF